MNRKKFQPYLELVKELAEHADEATYPARQQSVARLFFVRGFW